MATHPRKLILCVLMLAAFALATCKRATVSVPDNTDTTLVLFVGGFATDQTGDAYEWFKANHPDYSLVRFAPIDGYQTDVSGYVAKSKYAHLILVCHSWGGARCAADAQLIPRVDLLVMYDPVGFDQGAIRLPASVAKAIVFPRIDGRILPPYMASVSGPNEVEIVPMPGGHSDGCHNPDSFAAIARALVGFPYTHP